MLFYLTSRIVGTATAFLYPAYSSYKTLSQRPASEADLERWLMYWSVLGSLLAVEMFAEWSISWIPFYYTVKTLLLLYLSLPQTQGSTFIYINYLSPLLHEHEDQIDRSMTKVRGIVWEFVQTKARAFWEAMVASLGQQPGAPAAGIATAPPPTQNDPVSGPAQMAMGLWRAYGPMVLTTGAAMFKQMQPASTDAPHSQPQGGQQRTASFFAERPPPQPYPGSSSSSRVSSATTQSILERRRALEAELAALERIDPSGGSDASTPSSSPFASPTVPEFPIPSIAGMGGVSSTSTSSSASPSSSPYLRTRTASGIGLGRFEEIEMPPEGYDAGLDEGVGHSYEGGRPGQLPQRRSGSWFGWGSSAAPNEGYERVKDE
ncbi:hypothetical protein PQX77_000508 [Marasmius sp. AFHP31]|nr:hypothetical protein PQX77_000508 [Marasmius sp. AFHP31]